MPTAPNRQEDIPQLIKFVRQDLRRMTQVDLAKQIKATRAVIYNYESGRTPLTVEMKAVIFDALKITAAEMRLFYVALMAKDN